MEEISKAKRIAASDELNVTEALNEIGYNPDKQTKQRVYSSVQKFFEGVSYSLKEFFMKPEDKKNNIPEYLAVVFTGDDGSEVETSIGFWFKSVYHGEDVDQVKTTWKGLPSNIVNDTDFLTWLCKGNTFTVSENGAWEEPVTHVWNPNLPASRRPANVKKGKGWYEPNKKEKQKTWLYNFVVE